VRNGQKNSGEFFGNGAASAQDYFRELTRIIPQLPYGAIDSIISFLLQTFAEGRTVFVFGNGGSAASASHMMVDMNKGAADGLGGKLPKVIALTDNVPLLTAWANDSSYEHVFSEQLKNFIQEGDAAFAISASGNSPNVVLALATAREHGAATIGVTGHQGGKMKPLCDICAVVPCDNTQMIEDMHHAILHSIFTAVRERLRSVRPAAMATMAGQSQK
jgi:D-sedoheptulose 7-phosphate isomerase